MSDTTLAVQQPSAMEILQSAVTQGMGIDVIERLAKLQAEMADRDATKAFAEAFAKFKEKVPAIVKEAEIKVGTAVRSKYAKLDQIAEKVIPELLAVGITHRWKTRTADDGRTFVSCYLRHVLGHEEEGATLASAPDTSGSMNAIQGLGSTVSYLERYTFVASCGIVIKDKDDDGNGTTLPPAVSKSILEMMGAATGEQVLEIYKTAAKKAFESGDKLSVQALVASRDKCLAKLEEDANVAD